MKLLFTFLIYFCLALTLSGCQRDTAQEPDPYQTGYDAGYQEGYNSGQDQKNDENSPAAESPRPTRAPEKTAPEYGRTNPAPVGTEQTIKADYEGYTVSVTINSIARGQEAWEMVSAANQFNDAPPENMEYLVVNATVTALAADTDASLSIYGYSDFTAFSSSNAEYETPIVVDPEPALEGDIYEGGSITGYITFAVNKDDAAPKMVYLRQFDGSGGIWFSLSGQ